MKCGWPLANSPFWPPAAEVSCMTAPLFTPNWNCTEVPGGEDCVLQRNKRGGLRTGLWEGGAALIDAVPATATVDVEIGSRVGGSTAASQGRAFLRSVMRYFNNQESKSTSPANQSHLGSVLLKWQQRSAFATGEKQVPSYCVGRHTRHVIGLRGEQMETRKRNSGE